jgi:molybdopterin molybdotransferase
MSSCGAGEEYAFASPEAALEALRESIRPVASGRAPLAECAGRALAEDLVADRDSPPVDVSAMDGFAVASGAGAGSWRIAGTVTIGREPPRCSPGEAVRIVTGGAIPHGADAVLKHEDAVVDGDAVRAVPHVILQSGAHIRRRGENRRAGALVVAAGTELTAATLGALATFGAAAPLVRERVRVAIVATGDELRDVTDPCDPWSIRDSNGPALAALVSALPFVTVVSHERCGDDGDSLRSALRRAWSAADAILVTGGVSMGERDAVPRELEALGARPVFHRLPQRPGKPLYAATTDDGRPVLGLPGNPVSVLVTARRYAVAALRARAGLGPPHASRVSVSNADAQSIPLWWHRPVRRIDACNVELVPIRGSGDVASVASSDGFVEIPPNATGAGPWAYYGW